MNGLLIEPIQPRGNWQVVVSISSPQISTIVPKRLSLHDILSRDDQRMPEPADARLEVDGVAAVTNVVRRRRLARQHPERLAQSHDRAFEIGEVFGEARVRRRRSRR